MHWALRFPSQAATTRHKEKSIQCPAIDLQIRSQNYWLIGIAWPRLIASFQHVTHQSGSNWQVQGLARLLLQSPLTALHTSTFTSARNTRLIDDNQSSRNAKPSTVYTYIYKNREMSETGEHGLLSLDAFHVLNGTESKASQGQIV